MRITDAYIERLWNEPHLIGHIVGKDKLTHLHSEWIKYIWDSPFDTALQAHRGSFKTTAISAIGSVRWMMLHPDDRIALGRKTFTDAAAVVKTVEQIMQHPIIQQVFAHIHGKPPRFITKQHGFLTFDFKTSATPEGNLTAKGMTGWTGSHFDKILLDDFITLLDRVSKAEREKTKEILREIITNIIDPGKPVGFIGTPWHRDDAWTVLWNPEADPDGEDGGSFLKESPLLFPVDACGILSEADIARKRKGTTPFLFAANYDLDLRTDTSNLFQDPCYAPWDYQIQPVSAHLDSSFDGNHFSALTFLAKKANGRYQGIGYVDPGNVKNWTTFIMEKYKRLRTSTLYTETNADKGFVADKLGTLGAHTSTYAERQNKHMKISQHLYEAWPLIDWDPDTDPEYLNQILDYREGMEPDDAPDSAASLVREIHTPTVTSGNDSLYKW